MHEVGQPKPKAPGRRYGIPPSAKITPQDALRSVAALKTIRDIRCVLYDERDSDNALVKAFHRLEGAAMEEYRDEAQLHERLEHLRAEGLESKEVLVLGRFKGRLLQLCPGSRGMLCCRYRLINTCFNCLYDCAYCYLNSYLNSYGIFQFTNMDALRDELEGFYRDSDRDMVYRIGTGEFTDSLMFDELSGIAGMLIDAASNMDNVMLELKTKSSNVDHLLGIGAKGKAVLAWSLNTQRNIERYEAGTASLGERLDAAVRAAEAGYLLAFHFDPIIAGEEWRAEYGALVSALFSRINPEIVAWISLGCFRYGSGFKEAMRERFPDERLSLEEMFPGRDGKMRYLKPFRRTIYREMVSTIRAHAPKSYIYLCMEAEDMWRDVFGFSFAAPELFERDFGRHLRDSFW